MNRSEIIKNLIERNGAKCSVCGKKLSENCLRIDHIIPRGLGGNDEFDNLRLVCEDCNLRGAYPFIGYETETYITNLLSISSRFQNVRNINKNSDCLVDILAERLEGNHWQPLAIEVKVGGIATIPRIKAIIEQKNIVISQLNDKNQKYKFVLVVFARLSEEACQLLSENDVEVWDANYITEIFAKEIEQVPNEKMKVLLSSLQSPVRKIEQTYIKKLKDCPKGRENCYEYQNLIGEILSYLFCPPLSVPLKEKSDLSKVNRRDFIFPNYCDNGFWSFLRINYHADYIVVDAKNYVKCITKNDVLQMSNYLKAHGTGLFGLIVSRNGEGDSA